MTETGGWETIEAQVRGTQSFSVIEGRGQAGRKANLGV